MSEKDVACSQLYLLPEQDEITKQKCLSAFLQTLFVHSFLSQSKSKIKPKVKAKGKGQGQGQSQSQGQTKKSRKKKESGIKNPMK